MLKTMLHIILILLMGILTGTVLLVLVYCIPFERIFYNFSTGAEGIGRNPGWYQMVFDYDASTLDSVTESLMMKAAATPAPPSGENVLQQALRVYILNNEDVQFRYGLKFYKYDWLGKPYTSGSYERYWHGYVVFLKPLLYLFTAHDIIFLNIAAQMLTMYALMMVLRKKGRGELQIPFLSVWIISMQSVIMYSIDFAACFYIYSFMVMALLLSKKIREKYVYAFLIAGMCTSYLDFLTWPLITLGIPLTVFLYEEGGNVKRQCEKLLAASVSWGMGYGGMWAGKWVLASLFLKEDIIGDAVEAIGMRSVAAGNGSWFSYPDVVFRNVGVMLKKPYLLLFCIVFLWLLWRVIRNRRLGRRPVFLKMLPYFVLMLYPFIWYLVVKEHSGVHFWMTWRILMISVLAFLCGVLSCPGTKRGEDIF